jgi:hypothetical protein
MLEAELTTLINALDKLNDSASFAAKYGPFFFAVALLIVTPFGALAMFKKFLGERSGSRSYQSAYEDFRFYFRGTVVAGLACLTVGVAWWLFDSYREGERTKQLVADLGRQVSGLQTAIAEKKYAVVGVIVDGIKESDEFIPTFVDQQTIVFSRVPPTNNLFFVVLSDEAIPKDLNMMVSWAQHDTVANLRSRPISLALKMTLERKKIGRYRFQFDQQSAAAFIQPAL